MDLSKLNKLCCEVINFYNIKSRSIDLFNTKYTKYQNNEMNALLNKLNILITPKLIESLNNDYYSYYYIYLFCIIFKEELLTNKDILGIVINKKNADYFSVLEMNKELDDETIQTTYELINDNSYVYKGQIPFDYRYHILRRNEVDSEIKNKVLNTYSKKEIKSIIKSLRQDLIDKIYFNEINNRNELLNNKSVCDEYNVYKTLYLKNKSGR